MLVECHFEPRGDQGLEGFRCGAVYRAEKVVHPDQSYWRVWPTDGDYYECCSNRAFHRHFRNIK